MEHEGDEDTQLLLFLQIKHLAHLPSIIVFVITLILLSPLLSILQLSYTVEPPNNGHIGSGAFVRYWEVSLSRRVLLNCT